MSSFSGPLRTTATCATCATFSARRRCGSGALFGGLNCGRRDRRRRYGTAYVAMGDSYTSGPNIPTQSSAAGGCDRSSHDYPSDVAAALKLTLTDVSCSGATTANILNTTQDVSPGPDNPPQLSAVGSATQVVSLQIGGDNLGFTSIIENCIALTPWGPTKVGTNCRNYYDPGGKNSLASDVTALAQPIATILADIHTAAPGAKVFVVGYPDILPQNGACWPSMPFETADAEYLNSIEQDLNSMLQETAAANGATFVTLTRRARATMLAQPKAPAGLSPSCRPHPPTPFTPMPTARPPWQAN